jgi:hypothetical protein
MDQCGYPVGTRAVSFGHSGQCQDHGNPWPHSQNGSINFANSNGVSFGLAPPMVTATVCTPSVYSCMPSPPRVTMSGQRLDILNSVAAKLYGQKQPDPVGYGDSCPQCKLPYTAQAHVCDPVVSGLRISELRKMIRDEVVAALGVGAVSKSESTLREM